MKDLMTQLMRDEGAVKENGRHIVYTDSVGIHTLAYGRNIEEYGLNEEEALMLLRNDITRVIDDLADRLPWFNQLDEVRREVFINMAFNLGITRFMGFKRMLDAAEIGDYEMVPVEMMDSKWARQVGPRAERLARQWATGVRQ
ncbi:MAG: lysozyme [Candidatus Thiodiazotropha weberae]|nr:lysozyme [Candidatus Thiodiazotropha weberae]